MRQRQTHMTAVLLAAGDGTRFAGPTHKLLSPLRGLPLYQHALNAVIGSGIASIVVVTGAVDLVVPEGITVVHNSLWSTGQRSSVLAGITAARGSDAVIFGLADQPFVTSQSWQDVASATSPISIATYDGIRAHPVRLGLELWDEFIASTTEPDEGLRSFTRQHSQIVQEVACLGSLLISIPWRISNDGTKSSFHCARLN